MWERVYSPQWTMTIRTSTLTATEYAVLGLVRVAGSASGYELNRFASRTVAHMWAPAKSQLYAVLARLHDGGYLRSRAVKQSDRPDKRVYRLTRTGANALDEWLARRDLDVEVARNPFLLKLFFGRYALVEDLVEQVRAYRTAAQEELATYEEIEGRIREKDDVLFGYLTLRHGLATTRARIRWANETIRTLEARR